MEDGAIIIRCAGETFSLRNLVQTIPAQDTFQTVFEVLEQMAQDIHSNKSAVTEIQQKFERVTKLEAAVQAIDDKVNSTVSRTQTLEDSVNSQAKKIQKLETITKEREAMFAQLQLAVKDFQTTKTVLKADVDIMKDSLASALRTLDTLNQDHANLSQTSQAGISDLRRQCEQLRFDMQSFDSKLLPTIQERIDSALAIWEQKMGGICSGCKRLSPIVDDLNDLARTSHEQLKNIAERVQASETTLGKTSSIREELQLIQKSWMWSFAQNARSVVHVQAEFEKKLEALATHPLRSYYGGVDGGGSGGNSSNNGLAKAAQSVLTGAVLSPPSNSTLNSVGGPIHPHDPPAVREQKQRQDTLGQAPYLRFAEVVKRLDDHDKEIKRLEETKADARAVWAEFRNRPDMKDLESFWEDKIPEMEKRIAKRSASEALNDGEETNKRLKEVTEKVDVLSGKMNYFVDHDEFDAKMEEWATLVRATVRADDSCQWCRRPILARTPGEKTCACNMRERSQSRAPSDLSVYGTDNVPYKSDPEEAMKAPSTPSTPPIPFTPPHSMMGGGATARQGFASLKRPKTVAGMTLNNNNNSNNSNINLNKSAGNINIGKVIDHSNNGVVMSVQYMTLGLMEGDTRGGAMSR